MQPVRARMHSAADGMAPVVRCAQAATDCLQPVAHFTHSVTDDMLANTGKLLAGDRRQAGEHWGGRPIGANLRR
jgi:hypothetical protein